MRGGITGTNLAAGTIDSYISHVTNFVREQFPFFPHLDAIRTPQLRLMLDGWHKLDDAALPHRLLRRIPLGAAFVQAALAWTRAHTPDPYERARLSAAIAILYGACMRRSELLQVSGSLADHALRAHHGAFIWPQSPELYPFTSDPALFPPGYPCAFTVFNDSTKNSTTGIQPRAVVANPDPLSQFCLVRPVYDYIRAYTCTAGKGLFPGLSVDPIVHVLRAVATIHGVDPERCRCHGLRIGSLSQLNSNLCMDSPNEELKQAHGHWLSAGGHKPYDHAAIAHASRVAHAIYDTQFMSFEFLRFYYMAPPR